MKVVPFIVGLAILPGVDALAASNTYTINGDFVTASHAGNGYTYAYVATSRESAGAPQRTTYMAVAKQTCDAVACVEVVVFGFIPNEHFWFTTTHAELATTITPGPDLEIRARRVEIGTGTVTELPPPTGQVSMSFRKTRTFSQSQHGVVTRSHGGFTFKEVGFSTRASALASGSLLGTPISAKGEIGSAQGTTISVSRGTETP